MIKNNAASFQSIVAPLDRVDVDTDAIIPKQFLTSIERTGFGKFAFYQWRYLSGERPNPDFILNQPPYDKAQILLGRETFGCGSSREHAVWALKEHGFRCIIAPRFGDIFYGNAVNNGLIPALVSNADCDELFRLVKGHSGIQATIDLAQQVITLGTQSFNFSIEEHYKHQLTEGLDSIALTLQHEPTIKRFEEEHFTKFPWLKITS